jgi:gas vesicle protein
MAYSYDRDDTFAESGGGYLAGMFTGLAVGFGLGMLLAPRSGSELRQSIARSAGDLQRTAADTYQQASEKMRDVVDRGREVISRAQSSAEQATSGTTGTGQYGTGPRSTEPFSGAH